MRGPRAKVTLIIVLHVMPKSKGQGGVMAPGALDPRLGRRNRRLSAPR